MSNTLSNDVNTETIKRNIANIIEIENSAAWYVVSSDPENHLYMIHHRPEANLEEWGHLRGIVVDTEAKCIVSKPYSRTPIVQTDQLRAGEDGKLVLIDTDGNPHSLTMKDTRITTGFEGPLLTVFKHNGIVYRTTRKRLDPSRSRWGASKPFMEMYWDLGGPKDEDLFDPECQTSPVVHTFIIVHPDVLVVSKNQIDHGYLVYVGSKLEWSPGSEDCPYPSDQTQNWNFDETVGFETEVACGTPTTGTIYTPSDLDLVGANQHLKYGFHTPEPEWNELDDRMLPGEFVILYHKGQLIRVESLSYAWRSRVRDNNPNLLHRFYQLVSDSYISCDTTKGRDKFEKLYPTFVPYSSDTILQILNDEGPRVVWPQTGLYHDPENLMTKDSRMYNIWLAFLNAVPLCKQKIVSGYDNQLYRKRGQLIGWLRTLADQSKLDPAVFSKRAINIVEVAQRYAKARVDKGDNFDRNGRKQSVRDITKGNIKNLVSKEQGGSLYRLVREMDKYKREQEELRQANTEAVSSSQPNVHQPVEGRVVPGGQRFGERELEIAELVRECQE